MVGVGLFIVIYKPARCGCTMTPGISLIGYMKYFKVRSVVKVDAPVIKKLKHNYCFIGK